jgi:hypothetical protein
MFNQGLSLDQAPPIGVPFRFFLSAPLFGVLISFVFLFTLLLKFQINILTQSNRFNSSIYSGNFINDNFWSNATNDASSCRCNYKKTKIICKYRSSKFSSRELFMSFSFILEIKIFTSYWSFIFKSIAFLTFFMFQYKLLFKVEFLTSTVKAMRLFSVAGLITLILGLYLAISHITLNFDENIILFVNMHMLFAYLVLHFYL